MSALISRLGVAMCLSSAAVTACRQPQWRSSSRDWSNASVYASSIGRLDYLQPFVHGNRGRPPPPSAQKGAAAREEGEPTAARSPCGDPALPNRSDRQTTSVHLGKTRRRVA